MFGVGGQELVIIGLLLLIVFGPARVRDIARDFGRFTYKTRASIEEFKSEFTSIEDQATKRTKDSGNTKNS